MVSRIGMAVPLHCTSIGKAILSCLAESEVRAIVARTGLPARTAHTHTTADELLADLNVAGDRGWALDQEENELGVVCVGGPVRDHTGHVTAAVSVSQLRSDPEAVPVDRLGAQVQQRRAGVQRAGRTGMKAFQGRRVAVSVAREPTARVPARRGRRRGRPSCTP